MYPLVFSLLGIGLLVLRLCSRSSYILHGQFALSTCVLLATVVFSDEGAKWIVDKLPESIFMNDSKLAAESWLQSVTVPGLLAVISVQFLTVCLRQRRDRNIRQLKEDLNSANDKVNMLATNARTFTVGMIRNIGARLKFTNSDRITFYVLDTDQSGEEFFVNSGRYSKDPVFDKVDHHKYAADKGFINLAYRRSCIFECCDKGIETKTYRQWHAKSGLSTSRIASLKMKSKLYFGFAIETNGVASAVIMIESTEHDRFTEAELIDVMNAEKESLENFVANMKGLIALPSFAERAGF